MREQLIQYVELLFAGARDYEDIKQEILQNTLDRYDDLVAEGKVPEAAYRLAITGIGDISEILGTKPLTGTPVYHTHVQQPMESNDTPTKKLFRAIAVGLYILCPLPLFVLSDMGMDSLGFCGLLTIVAVATVLMMLGAKKSVKINQLEHSSRKPQSELSKSIRSVIWTVGLGVYFILSFSTNAWHITWVLFPIIAALQNLTGAILDLKGTPEFHNSMEDHAGLTKSINRMIWAVGLAIYFILSFATMAWYITWLLFPVIGAVQGLTKAVIDLKEAMENEK